jgi:hypothetical protein
VEKYDGLQQRAEDAEEVPEALPARIEREAPAPRKNARSENAQVGGAGALIGGLVMMLLGGALAWNMRGNRPHVHAIILFIIGLITFIRSLVALVRR